MRKSFVLKEYQLLFIQHSWEYIHMNHNIKHSECFSVLIHCHKDHEFLSYLTMSWYYFWINTPVIEKTFLLLSLYKHRKIKRKKKKVKIVIQLEIILLYSNLFRFKVSAIIKAMCWSGFFFILCKLLLLCSHGNWSDAVPGTSWRRFTTSTTNQITK